MQIVVLQCVFHALRRLVKAARKTKEIGASNLLARYELVKIDEFLFKLVFLLALALICISVCCLRLLCPHVVTYNVDLSAKVIP
jgi:hypothetical protein